MSCTLESKEASKLCVRVGMGRMTDDAVNLELPSVGCAQQTQKTSPPTKWNKSQKCSSTTITNKEALMKNKNKTFFILLLAKWSKTMVFLVFRLNCLKLH